jgi:hypothetical protein
MASTASAPPCAGPATSTARRRYSSGTGARATPADSLLPALGVGRKQASRPTRQLLEIPHATGRRHVGTLSPSFIESVTRDGRFSRAEGTRQPNFVRDHVPHIASLHLAASAAVARGRCFEKETQMSGAETSLILVLIAYLLK